MDTLLLDAPCHGVHGYQHPQTRDSRPDTHACIAKRMVCTTRIGIYVLIRTAWLRHNTRHSCTYGQERQIRQCHRATALRRRSLCHNRHAYGCYLGKGCLGSILELGCQGGVGGSDMGSLPCCHTPCVTPFDIHLSVAETHILYHNSRCIPRVADVLVGRQLPTHSRSERTHL